MYNSKVMELFQNPKNVGVIKGANAVGTASDDSCGDIVKLYLIINSLNIIEDVKYKVFGCAATIASCSVTSEYLIGKSVEQTLKVKTDDIINLLGGLPQNKIVCASLVVTTIAKAMKDYKKKQIRLLKKLSVL